MMQGALPLNQMLAQHVLQYLALLLKLPGCLKGAHLGRSPVVGTPPRCMCAVSATPKPSEMKGAHLGRSSVVGTPPRCRCAVS